MTYNLLIADDERLISESLSAMNEWKERGIEVVGIAFSGKEVLAWLDRTNIDFLITDIRMPDMDGLELLQYLYEHKPDIRTIIISGYEEFAYVKSALKYKAEGYVLKPIDTDELLAIVDELLADQDADKPITSATEFIPKTYHETVVERAISFIHDNLEKDIGLRDVAENFHLTTHYFGQVFKSVTGQTFLSFLTRLRMEKACELLKNPEFTQYGVGEQVGYKDPRYFSKVFQKTYSMSPREYRRHLKNRGYRSQD